MVRSRRSISKEYASSLLTDSGVSLSSPPAVAARDNDEEPIEKSCIKRPHDSDSEGEGVGSSKFDNDAHDVDYQLPVKKSRSNSIKSEAASITSTATGRTRTNASPARRKIYLCTVCDKEFTGNTDLKRHMLIHSNERPHKCDRCSKSYRQSVNLKNHITTVHEGRLQFPCTLCTKTFALKERLRLHMRLHSGEKPYACALCEKRFARGGQLQQHMISHHKDSIQQYNCTKCSASFSTNANLRVHMERHDEGVEYRCDLCGLHYPNDVVLRAHQNQDHYKLEQLDCEICHKTIVNSEIVAHMHKHAPIKMHVCEICNSYFTQKSQYNVHMRMHTGERPYQCRICYQTFAHSSVLKLHIRKHTGEKPFKCLLCKDDVGFSQLAHLKTHMKKIHKQLNPYMCEVCHEFFKIKVDLQAHQLDSTKCKISTDNSASSEETLALTNMRFHMAVILKKISSEQKLRHLGYEKRLIDNVIIASLKLANRTAHDDPKLSAIERLRLNVEEFLKWIVPVKAMEKFCEELLSIDTILDKIATMYMQQK